MFRMFQFPFWICRTQIVKSGLLPKLVPLIDDEQQRTVVLCLLYHLSMDDRCKSMFTYTDCVPLVSLSFESHFGVTRIQNCSYHDGDLKQYHYRTNNMLYLNQKYWDIEIVLSFCSNISFSSSTKTGYEISVGVIHRLHWFRVDGTRDQFGNK